MDQITQKNAELSSQSSESARALHNQSDMMLNLVSAFKTNTSKHTDNDDILFDMKHAQSS